MRTPVLLLAAMLGAAGLGVGCKATGAGGCRSATAAAAEVRAVTAADVQVAARPKPKKKADRKPICTKATSEVWQGFQPYRGDIKTNGLSGSKRRFYQWDNTHGDIEVYDGRGRHLGSMDAVSGAMTKPPEKGRDLGGIR